MDVRRAVWAAWAAWAACAVCAVGAASVADASDFKAPDVAGMGFMRRFGYLATNLAGAETIYDKKAVVAAVKQVQLFGGLPQTGTWDAATQRLLVSPRCGVPDVVTPGADADDDVATPDADADDAAAGSVRKRRFVVGAPGWNKRRITYFLSNWSPRLGEQVVRDALERAFASWAGYARLTFAPAHSRDTADIEVLFGSGPHGDGHAFDGAGNVLAHAYFPYEHDRLGGDMHFDADEPWTSPDVATSTSGVDFFSVAVHELGHSLGLAHSPVPTSIMFPYYQPPPGGAGATPLGYDDILAVYQLYISRRLPDDDLTTDAPAPSTTPSSRTPPPPTRTTPRPTTQTPPRSPPRTPPRTPGKPPATPRPRPSDDADAQAPDLCDGGWDAASRLRGELMIFKGRWLWRLSVRGRVQPGYPVPLRRLFPLPEDVDRVDAAYQRASDESLVLFAGKLFWVFDGSRFIEGSPRPITDLGLPTNLTHIDAAQVWAKNKKTFLYSGDEYWRFNEQGALEPGYPKPMARWRGVPSPLDAALTWSDGATYFFQGTRFWRFDNARIKVDERYPLPAGPGWLGCPEPLAWRRRRRRRRQANHSSF